MNRKRSRWLQILMGLLALAMIRPGFAAERPVPSPDPSKDWTEFRSAFPFHIQTLAINRPGKNSNATLIVSEPPPHLTLRDIVNVQPETLGKHTVQTWTIGFDGWVKDIVFTLPPMSDAAWKRLEQKLSLRLFDTAYGAHSIPLPLDALALSRKYPLDVRVATTDLEHWFTHKLFRSGQERRLLSALPPGVYFSDEPGLVAWVAPVETLDFRREEIRRFALDSDLILGAVGRSERVIIFGRERVAPVSVLPPLRTEMVLALAATKPKSLSQSYERGLFGLGSIQGRWDWAPIYLSPELLDTEYGSILNITDQMLKGWSLNGLIEYYNFPAALPSRMPFDSPLTFELNASTLLFNWNTSGFGAVTKTSVGEILAINRTGALPIIYRPNYQEGADNNNKADARTIRAEADGYTYYATLNHPYLARAVQYAALYQIFTRFNVEVRSQPNLPRWSQTAAMRKVARQIVEKLRTATERDMDQAVKRAVDDYLDRRDASGPRRSKIGVLVRALRVALGLDLPANNIAQIVIRSKLDSVRQDYVRFFGRHRDAGEQQVYSLLGAARDAPRRQRATKAAFEMTKKLREAREALWLCNSSELQKSFSQTRPASNNPWLRTPSVVYSRPLDQIAQTTGGHNLDSNLTPFERSIAVPPGSIRLSDGVLRSNPKDARIVERALQELRNAPTDAEKTRILESRIRETRMREARLRASGVRDLKSQPDPSKIQQLVSYSRAGAKRGINESLITPAGGGRVPPNSPPPASPGTLPPAEPPKRGPVNAPPSGKSEVLVVHQEGGIATLHREVEVDGKRTFSTPTESWNQRDLLSALRAELEAQGRTADKRPLRIAFDNSITKKQAERFIKDLAVHAERECPDRVILAYRSNTMPAAALNRPIKTPKAGRVSVDRGPGSAKVSGKVEAMVSEEGVSVEYSVLLTTRKEVTADKAQRSVNRGVSQAETLGDIAPEVYRSLKEDFEAMRELSSGEFLIGDWGDVQVTEFEFRGETIGVLAAIR